MMAVVVAAGSSSSSTTLSKDSSSPSPLAAYRDLHTFKSENQKQPSPDMVLEATTTSTRETPS